MVLPKKIRRALECVIDHQPHSLRPVTHLSDLKHRGIAPLLFGAQGNQI